MRCLANDAIVTIVVRKDTKQDGFARTTTLRVFGLTENLLMFPYVKWHSRSHIHNHLNLRIFNDRWQSILLTKNVYFVNKLTLHLLRMLILKK